MNYKGYIGKVEYDDENRVFTGSVVNVKTVITFHGSSVDELEEEFKASVDDYLDWCKEDGIEPEKPLKDGEQIGESSMIVMDSES